MFTVYTYKLYPQAKVGLVVAWWTYPRIPKTDLRAMQRPFELIAVAYRIYQMIITYMIIL